MTSAVSIENVSRQFADFTALGGVSLDIAAGEFIVLLGPSGCGKTTLLSILGGFLAPSGGRVLVDGKDMTHVAPARRPTTTIFQDYALFPHMTLADNVGFGLRMRGMGKTARREKALSFLDLVGLRASAGKKPHALSGGQRQRVALARALAVDPEVLLLDEPLGALDLKLRRQMQDELKAIQKRIGTTFVHVTHDQEEAMAIADRIVVMNRGKIEDVGAPEAVYMRPRSLFSAGFMGEVNMIPGRVLESAAGHARAETALGIVSLPQSAFTAGPVLPGHPVTLCVRPEQFRAGEMRGGEPGEGVRLSLGSGVITDAAFFGTHHRVHLSPAASPGLSLVAHLPQSSRPVVGDRLALATEATGVVALPGHPPGTAETGKTA
ncbi:ABC transporter ATP-binding protein [Rhizobium sp. SG2393]|uniref:ABC transporter ATP-binding protein n=1 Tax=Rhizobium sp. SG2393 TaxID=3276279 RepID=UPI0036701402